MNDPLGLAGFTDHILTSITAMAPVAAVGLALILVLYGALVRR
jgi:hypothetical protein